MKARLIKRGVPLPHEKRKRLAEVPIIETIRTWVRDFQSTRAERARLDFKRISNARKT